MLKQKSLPFIGFLQATGVSIYLLLLSCLFTFGLPRIADTDPEFYAPIIMLLLFMISAVITASLVLGRFGVFFWNKQYKEAFTLLIWTVGWMAFYFVLFLFIISIGI